MATKTHEFQGPKKLEKGVECCGCNKKFSDGFFSSKTGFQCKVCFISLCAKCYKQKSNIVNGQCGVTANAPEKDPVMDFYIKYVKRNAEGKMVVKGLPPEWKSIFREAGVRPKELRNPKTAIYLIGLMNDFLNTVTEGEGGANGEAPQHSEEPVIKAQALYNFDAQEDNDLSFQKGDIIIVLEKFTDGWARGRLGDNEGSFPFNYVEELPEEPVRKPPPPPVKHAAPTPTAPTPSTPSTPAPAPVQVTGGPPPPPMPTGGPKGAPPPPMPTSKPKPAPTGGPPPPSGGPPKPAPAPAGGRGGLLDQIKGGAQLKKVEPRAPTEKKGVNDLSGAQRDNMLSLLSQAMNARRKDLVDDDNSDDDDDDEWSD